MGHNGIEFGMERKLVTAAWAIGNKRNTWKKEEGRYIEVLSLVPYLRAICQQGIRPSYSKRKSG